MLGPAHYRRYLAGVALILLVDTLWTASNYLANTILYALLWKRALCSDAVQDPWIQSAFCCHLC